MFYKKFFAAGFLLIAVLPLSSLLSCKQEAILPPPRMINKEEKVFSFYNIDLEDDYSFQDPVAREITRQTGVKLLIHHPKSLSLQAQKLVLSEGISDDLIFAKDRITAFIEKGDIVALDDYIDKDGKHINLIEQYGENFRKLYGKNLSHLKYDDGHIYTFGAYGINQKTKNPSGTIQLQLAVLKELGYPKIETLDEVEAALKVYMEKYPTINGEKTIGLSLLTDDFHWYIGLSNPASLVLGFRDDGQWIVDQKTLKAQYKFLHSEMSTYFRWLNKLYAQGILDKESFVQSEDVWKAKIMSGCVLGISYSNWKYEDIEKVLISNGMEERSYACLPVTASHSIKNPELADTGYTGNWGIAISKKCKDVIGAFQFLDYMCSEEAQILVNWGIKDVNYRIENGKRVISAKDRRIQDSAQKYEKLTGVQLYTYPFPQAGTGALDVNGDFIVPQSTEKVPNKAQKAFFDAYSIDSYEDLFPKAEELPCSEYGQLWLYKVSDETLRVLSIADTFVKEALIQCVTCPIEEFDKNYELIVKKCLELGMDKQGEIMSDLIQQKIKLWNTQ